MSRVARNAEPDVARGPGAWRYVWFGLLALAAVVVTFVQIDRESRRRADLASVVPAPFRSFAFYTLLDQSVANSNGDRTAALSRDLTLKRPIAAEHLSVFAIGAALRGEDELALRALGMSAARGWREPIAQRAAAQGALQDGDIVSASQRALALWTAGERDENTMALLSDLAAAPGGGSEIGRWMSESSAARDAFLIWGARNLSPNPFGRAVGSALRRGTTFDCTKFANAAQRLLARGGAEGARAMWRGPCARGRATPSTIALAPRTDRDAFGWEPENGALFTRTGDEWRLDYENAKPGATLVAHAGAALMPGTYRVTMDERRDDSPSDVRLPVQLRFACVNHEGALTPQGTISFTGERAILSVPAKGCAAQRFQLAAPRGEGSIAKLSLNAGG